MRSCYDRILHFGIHVENLIWEKFLLCLEASARWSCGGYFVSKTFRLLFYLKKSPHNTHTKFLKIDWQWFSSLCLFYSFFIFPSRFGFDSKIMPKTSSLGGEHVLLLYSEIAFFINIHCSLRKKWHRIKPMNNHSISVRYHDYILKAIELHISTNNFLLILSNFICKWNFGHCIFDNNATCVYS